MIFHDAIKAAPFIVREMGRGDVGTQLDMQPSIDHWGPREGVALNELSGFISTKKRPAAATLPHAEHRWLVGSLPLAAGIVVQEVSGSSEKDSGVFSSIVLTDLTVVYKVDLERNVLRLLQPISRAPGIPVPIRTLTYAGTHQNQTASLAPLHDVTLRWRSALVGDSRSVRQAPQFDPLQHYDYFQAEDWDGMGADPISAETISAMKLLFLRYPLLTSGEFAPGADGSIGVVLTVHGGEVFFSIGPGFNWILKIDGRLVARAARVNHDLIALLDKFVAG